MNVKQYLGEQSRVVSDQVLSSRLIHDFLDGFGPCLQSVSKSLDLVPCPFHEIQGGDLAVHRPCKFRLTGEILINRGKQASQLPLYVSGRGQRGNRRSEDLIQVLIEHETQKIALVFCVKENRPDRNVGCECDLPRTRRFISLAPEYIKSCVFDAPELISFPPFP